VNFSPLELDAETLAFWTEVRAFFDEHVTEEVHELERRTGGGFNEDLHLAMGERGWVAPTWPPSEGGAGLDAIRAAIVAREMTRSGAPAILAGTTLLPASSIRAHGNEQLKRDVLPGIANGTIRVCLGYTEPDAGSDLAAVRTRAVRDGDEWVLNGQKMFTTGAQFCQYSFCLTRTNPDVAKHKGLTVFLVPLDLPGVEIRGIGTVGGERTNFVHYDDVRVLDHFRLGAVDAGWTVVSEPLAQEHGIGRDDPIAIEPPGSYVNTTRRLLATVVDLLRDACDDAGRARLEDPSALERLGRVVVDIEATHVTPGPMGRIISAETLVRDASDLLELVGPEGLLAHGADGAVQDGYAEYAFRFAPGTRIYGGSTDIHRNLVAEHVLGLPRSTPRA
jgi:alkylation response protein AidB-like acyl-CoA dehydrogenase